MIAADAQVLGRLAALTHRGKRRGQQVVAGELEHAAQQGIDAGDRRIARLRRVGRDELEVQRQRYGRTIVLGENLRGIGERALRAAYGDGVQSRAHLVHPAATTDVWREQLDGVAVAEMVQLEGFRDVAGAPR